MVTSTVEVSGIGKTLWDLNILTNISHTFASDLDITITSPAGTTVTLTTDNGGSNGNVFNGTLWDDSAAPTGALPYTNTAGQVTDTSYVNLQVQTTLTPEEPLGAFRGENPNGTWTLTVSDDFVADGGSLDVLTLQIVTSSLAVDTSASSCPVTPEVAIAISNTAVATSTVNVPADSSLGDLVCGITVTTGITHPNSADLDITLTSPTGTVVTLTTDNGGSSDNVFNGTVWSDDANPAGTLPYSTNNGLATDHAYANMTVATQLCPEEPFSAFIGEAAAGNWTLSISDDLAGDDGTLTSWTLDIERCMRPEVVPEGLVAGRKAHLWPPSKTNAFGRGHSLC